VASRGLIGALLGLAGLALAGGSFLLAGRGAYQSFLSAWLFWGGLSVGSLALLLVHRLTGGRWGDDLRPPLVAAAATLPLVALLAVPLLLGLADLYPWAAAGEGGGAAGPAWLLNPSFFAIRCLCYLAIWLALAWMVGAFGAPPRRLQGQGPGGLALSLLALTTTLAAFDWVMSLDPLWYSAVFGLLVGVAQATAGLALAVLWLAGAHGGRAGADRLHDAGNLLLAGVLLWSYLALMQFLTVWIANLPHEIRWYVPRLQTGWQWLGAAVVCLQLLAPLPLLLSRRAKRSPGALALAAGLILCAQALYALWLTLPTLRPRAPRLDAADLGLFLGLGGLWLGVLLWRLPGSGTTAATQREGAA
jgi:hypothetical protein